MQRNKIFVGIIVLNLYKQPNNIDDAKLGVEPENKLQNRDGCYDDDRFFIFDDEVFH